MTEQERIELLRNIFDASIREDRLIDFEFIRHALNQQIK